MLDSTLQFKNQQDLNLQAKTSITKMMKAIQFSANQVLNPSPKKLRVLSIDGGGIRAILPAMILAELEERLQQDSGNPEASIIDHFDFFAGTSAGAILTALYLTPGEENPHRPKFTAKEVLEIYLRDGCESFAKPNPDASKARIEKYCASTLEEKLQFLMGKENTLQQLLKPTLITAFDTLAKKPIYFQSWTAEDQIVWQVTRASSAAPGLFEPACLFLNGEEHFLMDGSIFASNPAMCAYAQANCTPFSKIEKAAFRRDCPTAKEMTLLSLGTGKEAPNAKNGKGRIRMLMNNFMTSGVELVDFQLQQIFSKNHQRDYIRFNPSLPDQEANIDNVGKDYVTTLTQLGKSYVEANTQQLDGLVKTLR